VSATYSWQAALWLPLQYGIEFFSFKIIPLEILKFHCNFIAPFYDVSGFNGKPSDETRGIRWLAQLNTHIAEPAVMWLTSEN
jgi:hypothetical protein